LKSRLLYWLTIVIAIVWILEIIIVFFAQGIFEPEFFVWLNRLTADLIILLALWLINRRYA
jgi:ABC-type nickel/cobalt efflux system permease component RcnA